MASGGGKTTTTQEVKLPEWMNQGGQQNYQSAAAWNAANPVVGYKGEVAPPMSANNAQAQDVASAATGTGQAQQGTATNLATAAGNATQERVSAGQDFRAPGVAGSYMSPYQRTAQADTLGEMNRQSELNQRQVSDAAGAAHAFGGDRHGIIAGMQARDDAAARNSYIAQSNEAAYQQGRDQFNTDRGVNLDTAKFNSNAGANDAARQLGAASTLSGIGSNSAGIASSDVSRLLTSGAVAQDTAASQDEAAYQEFLRMQNTPLDRYSQIAGILSGTPSNRTETGTTKKSGSLLNTILGAGQIAASIYSDARLKENVEATGEEWHGLPVYEFDYIPTAGLDLPAGRQRGIMAQEAIAMYPAAVSVANSGHLQVDYDLIARA